ncbi:PP2C family protein-serine/threonine phosphatase [Streptomyces mangrovisoli]|nr:PP2C family protein-serine/threonine phosphatase [Streptomyces mangrovisoli]
MLAPVALTAVLGLLAAFTPPEVAFTRLLPTAPALAASVWSVGATAVLGLVCLVAVLAHGLAFSDVSAGYTAGAIGAVTLAAAYASHLRTQREHTLAEVRAVADTTQEVLLRPVPSRIRGLEIATFYLAAAPQARIGGDFYAVADTDHGLRLVLGDVRGKGLRAVGVTAAILGSFHEAAYDAPGLAQLARRLDTAMARYTADAPSDDAAERFATAVIAQFPSAGGSVSILHCGHPPALLLRGGAIRALEPDVPSPPINMAALVGGDYHIGQFPLMDGDLLLLYTDGVTETRDPKGVFFPLADWAAQAAAGSPEEFLRLLHRALLDHSEGKLGDDIACVAVRSTPNAKVADERRPAGTRVG